jgi:hypothetical protein
MGVAAAGAAAAEHLPPQDELVDDGIYLVEEEGGEWEAVDEGGATGTGGEAADAGGAGAGAGAAAPLAPGSSAAPHSF